MGQINAGRFISSTGIEFPSYTESQKPTNLGTGATIYNSDTEKLETWNGNRGSRGGSPEPTWKEIKGVCSVHEKVTARANGRRNALTLNGHSRPQKD